MILSFSIVIVWMFCCRFVLFTVVFSSVVSCYEASFEKYFGPLSPLYHVYPHLAIYFVSPFGRYLTFHYLTSTG